MAQRLRTPAVFLEDEEVWGPLGEDFDWGVSSAALIVLLTGVLVGFALGFLSGAWLL
jgi:hypothetical protein